MNKTIPLALALIVVALLIPVTGSAQDRDEVDEAIARLREADPGIDSFFADSEGYAIFPSVGKGGFGIGAAHGGGLVFRGGRVVGKVTLKQISIGFQLGGQKFIEAIFFDDAAAFERFIGSNYEFNAQVSAVALTDGESADASYAHGVAVFTVTLGGLMYEAAVGGQKFSYKPN